MVWGGGLSGKAKVLVKDYEVAEMTAQGDTGALDVTLLPRLRTNNRALEDSVKRYQGQTEHMRYAERRKRKMSKALVRDQPPSQLVRYFPRRGRGGQEFRRG